MSEELKRADTLLRVVARVLDILILAAAWELLPKAGFAAGIVYILIGDGLLEGRSIGKKIIGLQVISLTTKTPCSIRESIFRNLPLAIGFIALKVPYVGWIVALAICVIEFLLIVAGSDGMRAGDMLANNAVVVRRGIDKDKER
ncbi:MAG: RDD family protein, partial [bacterium]